VQALVRAKVDTSQLNDIGLTGWQLAEEMRRRHVSKVRGHIAVPVQPHTERVSPLRQVLSRYAKKGHTLLEAEALTMPKILAWQKPADGRDARRAPE
jgi:hypothetical protein